MSARCTAEPISWLRLEQHQLGEGTAEARAAVEAHLAECPACAACLASIVQDEAVALPPLPAAAPRSAPTPRWGGRRAGYVAGGLAMAAATVLVLRGQAPPAGGDGRGAIAGIKGGDVAFTLVRDDAVTVTGDRGTFHDGDRFKAEVTCPPAMTGAFDLVVLDGDGASFPLAPARVACGNAVPLPGAFRLTGATVETVCLVWTAEGGPPDRGTVSQGRSGLGERARCKTLDPAGPGPRPQ